MNAARYFRSDVFPLLKFLQGFFFQVEDVRDLSSDGFRGGFANEPNAQSVDQSVYRLFFGCLDRLLQFLN